MRAVLGVARAIADPTRMRILHMLAGGGELCVCQITHVLALAPSTVSKHLSILDATRLVEARKEGRWVYYRLPGPDAPREAQQALWWLFCFLGEDPVLLTDKRALAEVLAISKETLCDIQAGRSGSSSSVRAIPAAAR